MTATKELPRLQDGHPSTEYRHVGFEDWEPVPCGDWYNGGKVFCKAHEDYFAEQYPQGWASYPGDVCVHGVYVGGCGIDWMCHDCEMGYTKWVAEPWYKLQVHLISPDGAKLGSPLEVMRWTDIDSPKVARAIFRAAIKWNRMLDKADGFSIEYEAIKVSDGYWSEP